MNAFEVFTGHYNLAHWDDDNNKLRKKCLFFFSFFFSRLSIFATFFPAAEILTSQKHLRTKVTPDFQLTYSEDWGNLGSESK